MIDWSRALRQLVMGIVNAFAAALAMLLGLDEEPNF